MKIRVKHFYRCIIILLLVSCSEEPCNYVWSGTSSLSEKCNAKETLRIRNYLGNYQNIHPKILYFKDSWNGFRFWMSYTPYPKGKTDAENPCIAVSNDGVNWSVPAGLSNPLASKFKGGYNSDTHLVYNEEKNQLEIWWRAYYEKSGNDVIFRRCSADGVSWSAPEIMMPEDPETGRLSPAVWIENGIYNLVYSDGARLKRVTLISHDGETPVWSDPQMIPIDRGELRFWHHDIIKNDEGIYQIVACAYGPGCNNNCADLYYVEVSSDFKSATPPVLILRRNPDKKAFDHRSIYRASLVHVDGLYYLYYSAIDQDWNRAMALSIGDSPYSLIGLGN